MTNRDNLGALTTVFTPPGECDELFGYTQFWHNPTANYLVWGPAVGSCFPDQYIPDRTLYYSPGSDCPSAYTPACASLNVAGTVTDTVYWCCPTHLDFECLSTPDVVWPWLSTLGCVSTLTTSADGFWTLSPVTKVSYGVTEVTEWVGNFGAANAYSVQVRFNSEAETTSVETTAETSGITSNTDSGTSSTRSQAPEQTNSEGDNGGGGLSTGAAAGIGVGAGLGVILIAIVAFLLFRRRKKQQQQQLYYNGPPGYPPGTYPPGLYPPGPYYNQQYPQLPTGSELPSEERNKVHEMYSQPAEIQDTQRTY